MTEIGVASQRNLKPFDFKNVLAIFATDKSFYTSTLITRIFLSGGSTKIGSIFYITMKFLRHCLWQHLAIYIPDEIKHFQRFLTCGRHIKACMLLNFIMHSMLMSIKSNLSL